jgi:hypothetical protein
MVSSRASSSKGRLPQKRPRRQPPLVSMPWPFCSHTAPTRPRSRGRQRRWQRSDNTRFGHWTVAGGVSSKQCRPGQRKGRRGDDRQRRHEIWRRQQSSTQGTRKAGGRNRQGSKGHYVAVSRRVDEVRSLLKRKYHHYRPLLVGVDGSLLPVGGGLLVLKQLRLQLDCTKS